MLHSIQTQIHFSFEVFKNKEGKPLYLKGNNTKQETIENGNQ